MVRFTTLIAPVLPVVLVLLPGCRSGSGTPMPDYGSEEGLKIAQAVSTFNDTKGDLAKFKKMFAGNAPANWKEYGKHVYEVEVGSPKVEGAGATATVTVRNESNYEVIATKEWKFAKVGEDWKIKDAPLR
jgi:hypothetical protein